MRTIKAIFEIEEDSNIAGVMFECEGNTIRWQDMSRLEQIGMLNAWASHYQLFSRFIKKED